MKQKEIIQLAVAIIIIAAAGLLVFNQLRPAKPAAKKAPTYEKITKVEPDFDEASLKLINDDSQVFDFYTAPDLKNGLGNSQPFGPLQ